MACLWSVVSTYIRVSNQRQCCSFFAVFSCSNTKVSDVIGSAMADVSILEVFGAYLLMVVFMIAVVIVRVAAVQVVKSYERPGSNRLSIPVAVLL
jgi:cell division protein FtsX